MLLDIPGFGRGILRTIQGWEFSFPLPSQIWDLGQNPARNAEKKNPKPSQLSRAAPRNRSHPHPNLRPVQKKSWKRETKEPESLESNIWEQPAVLGRGQLSLAAVTGASAIQTRSKIPRLVPAAGMAGNKSLGSAGSWIPGLAAGNGSLGCAESGFEGHSGKIRPIKCAGLVLGVENLVGEFS